MVNGRIGPTGQPVAKHAVEVPNIEQENVILLSHRVVVSSVNFIPDN